MLKEIRRRDFLGMSLASVALPDFVVWRDPTSSSANPESTQWDYQTKAVAVVNPDLKETWNNASRFAFDGYGGSRHPRSIAHGWFQQGTPSKEKPFRCT